MLPSLSAKLPSMRKTTHIPISEVPESFHQYIDLALKHGKVIFDRSDGWSVVLEPVPESTEETKTQSPAPEPY